MSKLAWKPWHQVVKLREDLEKGELPLQMFAADLYEVLMGRGKQPVYEQPESFFALTFPTHNLRNLVRDVGLRRELEAYGGGLAEKPELIGLNKADAMTPREASARLAALRKASRGAVMLLSGVTGQGVPEVLRELSLVRKTEEDNVGERHVAFVP